MTRTVYAKRTVKSSRLERYQEALQQIPPPGCGCHTSLLSVANLGAIAEIPPQEIFEDIRQNIPEGSRRISDREIQDALKKAITERIGETFTPRPRPVSIVKNGKEALQNIINQADISDEADVWECSPFRILNEPKDDPVFFLKTLFRDTDKIWIGEKYDTDTGVIGDAIRAVAEWITYFENGGKTAPHIIVNPLSGTPAPKESGDGETYRGNNNITAYRYCLVEFDNLSREDQIRFWTVIKLPIVALIDTGGKSIHGWLDVHELTPVATSEQWQADIRGRLYDRILTPLGVDTACSNPARLSRLPGHYREEKGKYQRLLWIAPEGRPVCQ